MTDGEAPPDEDAPYLRGKETWNRDMLSEVREREREKKKHKIAENERLGESPNHPKPPEQYIKKQLFQDDDDDDDDKSVCFLFVDCCIIDCPCTYTN